MVVVVVEDIGHLGCHSRPSIEEVVHFLLPSLVILGFIHTMVPIIHIVVVIIHTVVVVIIHIVVVVIIHTIEVVIIHTIEVAYSSRIATEEATIRTIMVVAIVHIIEVVACSNRIVMVGVVTSLGLHIVLVVVQVVQEVVHCNPCIRPLEGHYTKYYLLHSSS